jgi:MoxR-like ATPase
MSLDLLEPSGTHNRVTHNRLHVLPADPAASLEEVRTLIRSLGARCRATVQGRDEVIDLILTALLADGHVLLEDHPGSGKTTLAKTLGESIVRPVNSQPIVSFRRMQFTPDMLPSDITGVTMFDPHTRTFEFRAGPIFANVVLADEINRTSPKVQAALLEAMAEKQVTVDNQTHRLEDLFFVMATQNPLDQAGTYPLPKAQLDRFLFKIKMTYLSMKSELEVLGSWKTARTSPPRFQATPAAIVAARETIAQAVHVSPVIHDCLVQIAHALRHDKRVALGISTRSLVLALPALQAWAVMQGRDFVSLKDIKALATPLFCHRLDLVPGGRSAEDIVNECVTPVVEALTRKTLKG